MARPLRDLRSALSMLPLFVASASSCIDARPHADHSFVDRPPEPGVTSCNGKHYWTDGSLGRTWEEARAVCRSYGGDLASLHSDADEACAIAIVGPSGNIPNGAWIGLREEQEEGAWRWSDGTPVNFVGWLKGEPNNDSGGPHDCAHLWRENNFQWNDIACSRNDVSYLCELP